MGKHTEKAFINGRLHAVFNWAHGIKMVSYEICVRPSLCYNSNWLVLSSSHREYQSRSHWPVFRVLAIETAMDPNGNCKFGRTNWQSTAKPFQPMYTNGNLVVDACKRHFMIDQVCQIYVYMFFYIIFIYIYMQLFVESTFWCITRFVWISVCMGIHLCMLVHIYACTYMCIHAYRYAYFS